MDLHKEEGRDIVRRLANRMDVLVENFRPGVMEKWGLGPQVQNLVFNCIASDVVQSWMYKNVLMPSLSYTCF